MKKLCLIFSIAVMIFAGIFAGRALPRASASAATGGFENAFLTEFASYKTRDPGSEGEKQAANYIKTKLDSFSSANFGPADSSSVKGGVQEFSFTSSIDGLNKKSQNLVYFYKSNVQTDKKLILGCNYDNIAIETDGFEYALTESEGINGSAGSVAVLLSIAKLLPSLNLPYNVEIIFFGAGESNLAGSKFYSKGILPETKTNILAYINIDSVAVGKSLYFYVDEVDTVFSGYVSDAVSASGVKKIDTVHLGKVMTDYDNELGLKYSHVAQNSDNKTFMSEQILSINLFAGDYDSGIVYGKNEFANEENVIYTGNDSRAYIASKYGQNAVSDNLSATFGAITKLISDENFQASCVAAFGQTNLFYKVFGSSQVIAYITAVTLIILIAVAIYLHYRLTLKSYDANIEPEFLTTVISISEHIDDTLLDENVPKAVSQVIANDIKKDKMLKPDKKKKDS